MSNNTSQQEFFKQLGSALLDIRNEALNSIPPGYTHLKAEEKILPDDLVWTVTGGFQKAGSLNIIGSIVGEKAGNFYAVVRLEEAAREARATINQG